jgi:radical SAM protein with 4Fe4S-binding SPASM domain
VLYLHRLGVADIDVGPAYGTVRWHPEEVEAMAKSLSDVARLICLERLQGRSLRVAPLLETSEHRDGRLADCWGCGAVSTQLAVLPDGRITGCSALAMLIERFPLLCLGSVHSGLKDDAVDALSQVVGAGRESRPVCASCTTAENCAGGCLAINLSQSGDPFVPPRLYCEVIRKIPGAWREAHDNSHAPPVTP